MLHESPDVDIHCVWCKMIWNRNRKCDNEECKAENRDTLSNEIIQGIYNGNMTVESDSFYPVFFNLHKEEWTHWNQYGLFHNIQTN